MKSNLQNRRTLNIFSESIESAPVFFIAFIGLKSGRWEELFKQAAQSTGLEGNLDVT